MKSIQKHSLFLLLVLLCTSIMAQSQEDIAFALRNGNSETLGKYFGNSVELTIDSDEQVYSKAQAKEVIKNFFAENKAQGFSLVHKGNSKSNANYGIGTLTTSNGSYRVYFFLKPMGSNYFIQEMRIESK